MQTPPILVGYPYYPAHWWKALPMPCLSRASHCDRRASSAPLISPHRTCALSPDHIFISDLTSPPHRPVPSASHTHPAMDGSFPICYSIFPFPSASCYSSIYTPSELLLCLHLSLRIPFVVPISPGSTGAISVRDLITHHLRSVPYHTQTDLRLVHYHIPHPHVQSHTFSSLPFHAVSSLPHLPSPCHPLTMIAPHV